MSVTAELDRPGTTALPAPSRSHATCAWCHAEFTTVVALIDHADAGHHGAARRSWSPSAGEVKAIITELRPLICAFAERDARRLAVWAAEDGEPAAAAA